MQLTSNPKAPPIFDTIDMGDAARVRATILQNYQDILVVNHLGDTALHHAAVHEPQGEVRCLNALLEGSKLDINAKNSAGWTPLHGAAIHGRSNAFRSLVRNGADVSLQERTGQTPLHCAAELGQSACLEAAVDCGVTLTVKNAAKELPLHLATSGGEEECVRVLLGPKRNGVNTQDAAGRTPLHSAALFGNEPIVKLLLAKGADRDIVDNEGKTACDLALEAGNQECAVAVAPKEDENPQGGLQSLLAAAGASAPSEIDGLTPAPSDLRAAMQALVADPSMQVIQVLKNRNAALWASFDKRIDDMSLHFVRKLKDVRTASAEACLNGGTAMRADVNEFLLFCGTTPKLAKAVCTEGFTDLAAPSGTRFGVGLYLTEFAPRAGERAKDDQDGLYRGLKAMLLCRSALGNCILNPERQEQDEMMEQLDSQEHHCILSAGDAASGREFFVKDAQQVFPAYVIIYRDVVV